MNKLSDKKYHSTLRYAQKDGYPSLEFETWYQQGMRCYQANLPKPLRKQAFIAVKAYWAATLKEVKYWHIRAFVYGSMGLDSAGQRARYVRDSYEWPQPPDHSWELVVCCYPGGEIDLDFAHPISRRFWSEGNGFLDPPEDRPCRFNRGWYEQMGFKVMTMMPIAQFSMAPSHLRVV